MQSQENGQLGGACTLIQERGNYRASLNVDKRILKSPPYWHRV